MVFSARYGLKIASFNGFVREYITSIEACSGTKLFLQSEPGSVSNNVKFSRQICSEANRKKGKTCVIMSLAFLLMISYYVSFMACHDSIVMEYFANVSCIFKV